MTFVLVSSCAVALTVATVFSLVVLAKDSTKLPVNTRAPALLISLTFHSRFKPVLHSFRYPILYICVDLDSIGWVNRIFSTTPKAWRVLRLDSDDYLGTQHTGSIKQKLLHHISDHGIDTTNLEKAILITTPRLFGYSFNPVSFHYVYDVESVLRVVVLEVNNTFGEKHVYVLKQEDATDHVRAGYDSAQTFPRRFHVSPFNDRSGHYQLQCVDPLATSDLRVDMHLTLLEAEGGRKKLTAQVNSTQPAIPVSCTWSCIWTIIRYGTAVFLTMPRILRQAWTLHYAKKLSVYMRPEPFEDPGAIGRQGISSTDAYFMDLWISYLKSNAEWLQVARVVIDVLPTSRQIVIDAQGAEELHIKVYSSTFFSSLATAESALTMLWTESMALESPLFQVSDARLFLTVFGSGFTGILPGRRYLQTFRESYRGRPEWFNEEIKKCAPQYTEFLSMTNRGLDNHVHDMALKGQESNWRYRYNIITSLWLRHLGDALFSALATFIDTTGPRDEWTRVKRALEAASEKQ